VRAVASTLAEAFESSVLVLRVPSARNLTLFARRGAELVLPADATWERVGEPIASALLGKRELPSAWTTVHPGEGRVLTDDRNAVELLQLRSIDEARRRRESVRGGT
jgi:hypothetical protein